MTRKIAKGTERRPKGPRTPEARARCRAAATRSGRFTAMAYTMRRTCRELRRAQQAATLALRRSQADIGDHLRAMDEAILAVAQLVENGALVSPSRPEQ